MNRKFTFSNLAKYTLFILALYCTLSTPAEAARSKSTRTTSSILIDAQTGDVLSASNADALRFPASLTKVMTLYITFDAIEKGLIKFDDKLPVSRHAANMAPSKLGLKAGDKISVRDAVMAVVVKSANDCAAVLAEGLGYSEENFAKTMTDVANELGMKNTVYKNASGLPHKDQKTTARDMAILAAAMYHHFPKHYKLFATQKFTYQGKTIYTHNHLLKTFSGADGLKTGFTNAAGYNIITSAQRNGNRVIAVTMGHDSIRMRDTKVAQMMNQGLQKLALSNNVETPNLYAEVEPKISQPEVTETIVSKHTDNQKIENNDSWGIQIGAFSNYAKARNYALSIKKEIKHTYASKSKIDIEAAQKGAAIIYRSKLIGLAKNEADKTCNSLKKINKSCIVIASISNNQLVLANID